MKKIFIIIFLLSLVGILKAADYPKYSADYVLSNVYKSTSNYINIRGIITNINETKTYASLQGKRTVSGTIASTNTITGIFIQVKGGKCDFHFSWNEVPNDLTLEDGEGFGVELPVPYKSNGDFLFFTLTPGATLQYYINLLK